MLQATRTGDLVVRAEVDDSLRRGVVALPHGYGQSYPDGEGRVVVGPRLNLITASEDCDPIAATPYHKNVAVRLAAADSASSADAEAMSARIRSIATPPTLQGQWRLHERSEDVNGEVKLHEFLRENY